MKLDDVYGYIALNLEKGVKNFTQKEISTKLRGSISTVNYAITPLEKIGCITKKTRGFSIIDAKRFLIYWAVVHKQNIEYTTETIYNVEEVEAMMPPCLYTAYSGAKIYYEINPTDYNEVYVYGNCKIINERFPRRKGTTKIYCLKKPEFLNNIKKTPLTLIYVDLFNLSTWYAKEFLKIAEAKINELLER